MNVTTLRRVKSSLSLIGIDALLIPVGIAVLSAITDNNVIVDGQLGAWFGAGTLTYILVRTALYQLVASALNWLSTHKEVKGRGKFSTAKAVKEEDSALI